MTEHLRPWTSWTPILAALVLAASWGRDPGALVAAVVAVVLGAAVLASVHHAEVIAERVGEPFGSLVLAVAVTIIEVALIVTMMMAGGNGSETLARDTVFAAVMITCNVIVGASIVAGSRGGRMVLFNPEGAGGALATVATVTVLCLVLPSFTVSASGPRFSPSQLAFAGIASLGCYLMFVVTQTVKHRDFFLPVDQDGNGVIDADEHHAQPSSRRTTASVALLLLSLVTVVGLAKVLSHPMERAVAALGFPHAFVGVVISLVVLAPETLSAVRNAARDRMQISLNLAYGSAMASVGMTIPVLAVLTLALDMPLVLGLGGVHLALLALTMLVGVLTVNTGRVVKLHGFLHLAIAAAFVFLSATP